MPYDFFIDDNVYRTEQYIIYQTKLLPAISFLQFMNLTSYRTLFIFSSSFSALVIHHTLH